MRKSLAFLVAFTLVSTMVLAFLPPLTAFADTGDPDGKVMRRALVIGNAKYAMSPLDAPVYDARHMQELFKQMEFSGELGGAAEQGEMLDGNIAMRADRTRTQMLQDIAEAFAGADADDVSYFYYSGHGSVYNSEAQLVGVDLTYLSLSDLKEALDKVPGVKVVMLDSCFSGGFIGGGASAREAMFSPAGTLNAGNKKHNAGKTASPVDIPTLDKNKSRSMDELIPAALRHDPPKKGEPLQGQFNNSVQDEFSKASRYLNGGKYIVITAAAENQYSYEFAFGLTYGPMFLMNELDLANRNLAFSGEFTGMLVAGAGVVTFCQAYGQTGMLADFDGDKEVTASELEYYLKGAVISSDIQLYVDDDPSLSTGTVLFSLPGATSFDNPSRVSLAGGNGTVTTAADATSIGINVTPPAGINSNLLVYRFPKETDGSAANGEMGALVVKTFEGVTVGTVTWDGKDENGVPVADGAYRIILEAGEDQIQEGDLPYIYPGLAVNLKRGITEFTALNDISDGLVRSGTTYTKSGTATVAADGEEQCLWFTAPVSGAMNIYADLSGLTAGKVATCTLYDGRGDIVNYNYGLAGKSIYLPFAVEQGKEYYLKMGLVDDPDKAGDTGSFGYVLKLNLAVNSNDPVSAAGNQYEAWLIDPQSDGDYVIMADGAADTVAMLVDKNQISRIAASDDFNDKDFLIRAPMLKGHPCLLVVASYDYQEALTYSFIVSDPGNGPEFSTAGLTAFGDIDTLDSFNVKSTAGAPVYRVIRTGDNPEKWTFFTDPRYNGPDTGMQNDPFLMVMDTDYNLVGANDDYNEGYFEDLDDETMDYNAACAVILEANSTYILACRSSYMGRYDFSVSPVAQELTEDDLVVRTPKAVFTDNSGLSLDRYGNISSWGENDYGELGLGTFFDPSAVPQTVILPTFDQAVDIWASDTVVFARLMDEQYCYWGIPFYSGESAAGSLSPMLLSCLEGMDIADIQCDAGTLALVRTYTGDLYMLDLEEEELAAVALPAPVLPHSVRQILASDFSFFALTYDGSLYAWGDNWTGECGVGSKSAVEDPTKVIFAGGADIAMIAGGWDHVLALSEDGDVFAWGYNGHNELGVSTGTKTYAAAPVKVTGGAIAGKEIAAVYAGANHSMCVGADGDVYAWGLNTFSDLGLGHAAMVPVPVKVGFYNAGGPDNVSVMTMSAGMNAVFAQDFSHNVYGYGSNMDYQLARDGLPPKAGIAKLMTLRGDVISGHSAELAALHTDKGYTYIEGDEIWVSVGEDVETVYVQPEMIDTDAACTIGGSAERGLTIDTPNPGAVTTPPIAVVVSHDGLTAKHYKLYVMRDECTDASLKSMTVTAGASLSPAFAPTRYSYVITLPEPMTRARVTPTVAGYGAHYYIDSLAADTTKLYTPAAGQTIYSTVTVEAQNDWYSETYNLTVRRPYMLSALSATPLYTGYPSLSPGGTNRMRIAYTLTFPAAVKIEVKKGTAWVTVMTRTEATAGAKYWDWDGKAGGAYLAAGTYQVRVTPTYGGAACTSKLLNVKILSKPSVSIPYVSASTFKVTSTSKLTFTVKWTVISGVKVEIVNASGAVVYTVWNVANQAPLTKTLYWNGRNASNALVPKGAYRIKVTCGSAAPVYRTINVTR